MSEKKIEADAIAQAFMTHLNSAQEVRDWVLTYLDIDLPLGHVDPDSNSSPAEWLWEAYRTYKENKGDEKPGFIVLSARDGYKTLTESMFAVLVMSHFGATIAHLAAIESQAKKAVQYVSDFVKKVKPYLEAHGRIVDSENKRQIVILDKDGNRAFLNVIIATLQGANSEHTTVLSIDEVDVMRFPKAYKEAKFIPAPYKGQHPITILTSTRKFAFGMMEQEIQEAKANGNVLLRWNLLDVTERCPKSRHQPHKAKVVRYIHPRLPLRNLSPEEYESLPPEKQGDFKQIKAYAGCAKCPLLPVCQMRLAKRPKTDYGGLYKPISFTINQFKKTDPDMAEAQLMCWKPSQTGLVYGRYDETPGKGNLMTIEQAWDKFTGGAKRPKVLTLKMLVDLLLSKGVKFDAMGDWGYRHAFAVVVGCQVMGEWWLVDGVSIPGLDPDQQISAAKALRDRYRVRRWFMDPSQPGMMALFKKHGMPCKKFTKDVQLGIACVRTQVVDAAGVRRLRLIEHEGNTWLQQGFLKHHFKLDSEGEPTNEPDDDEYADIMDSVRYGGQNLFGKGGKAIVGADQARIPQDPRVIGVVPHQDQVYESWITQRARALATEGDVSGSNPSKTIFWTFGDGSS